MSDDRTISLTLRATDSNRVRAENLFKATGVCGDRNYEHATILRFMDLLDKYSDIDEQAESEGSE